MEKSPFEQRLRQRQEQQQQPQQCVIFPTSLKQASTKSPRKIHHALTIMQARKQSGEL